MAKVGNIYVDAALGFIANAPFLKISVPEDSEIPSVTFDGGTDKGETK